MWASAGLGLRGERGLECRVEIAGPGVGFWGGDAEDIVQKRTAPVIKVC